MVATAVLLLLHTPPVVALVMVINEPRQAAVGPPMAATVGALLTVTVTTADALQPALLVTV